MNPEQRAELRRLCEGATPGPWCVDDYVCNPGDSCKWHVFESGEDDGPLLSGNEHDSRFSAASRTALPALLDYVERLEGEIERLKKEKA